MNVTEEVETLERSENPTVEAQQSNESDIENEDNSEAKNRTLKALSDSKLIAKKVDCADPAVLAKSKSDGQLVPVSTLEAKLRELVSIKENASNQNDTSSDASSICLSVHDYENMPVFNVNRTDWGIRHWKSYSDIENSFHDNSISKEKEPFEVSIASSSDSNRMVTNNDSHKISIEEAISQLKSLAVNGSNVYQRAANVDNQNNTNIYECIWLNEMKVCPTTGHNLSTITEESETSSNKSKSSLVQTVETLINASISSSSTASAEDESQLTYVEVSFLSKLASSQEDLSRCTPHQKQSIQFEPSGSKRSLSYAQCNKENEQDSQPALFKPGVPKRKSSLSPNSCILPPFENKTGRHLNNLI